MNQFIANQKKKTKNNKGFTLIELIVVIAILGILAAIAVPRLGAFRGNAEDQAEIATARTIVSAAMITEANIGSTFDTDDLAPNIETTVTVIESGGTATATGWTLEKSNPWKVYHDGTVVVIPTN